MNENRGAFSHMVGAASTAVWTDLKFRYIYSGSIWRKLAEGKGWQHSGVFNYGKVGIGRKIGNLISEEVSPGAYKGGWFRHGARTFFAGGEVGGYGYSPEAYTAARNIISDKLASESGITAAKKIISRVGWIRGIGIAGTAMTTSAWVMAIAPLAYHAGKGLVNVAQVLRVPMNRMNATDWGGQLASGYMTAQAHTERQRGLQVMNQAGIRGPSSLGQEASFMHQ